MSRSTACMSPGEGSLVRAGNEARVASLHCDGNAVDEHSAGSGFVDVCGLDSV